MKAVVYHAVGDIRFEDVPEPRILAPTDAIVRITATAICGTDLHFVRGTVSGMQPGTILGHEGVGIVEALGADVRNLQIGDRVVIPPPSPVATVPIAGPATSPSAMARTRTARRPAPRSMAVRRPPDHSMVCRLRRPVSRSPTSGWSNCHRRSATIRRFCSLTSSPPATSAPRWPRWAAATPWRCSGAARWASSPLPAPSCWALAGVRHRPP